MKQSELKNIIKEAILKEFGLNERNINTVETNKIINKLYIVANKFNGVFRDMGWENVDKIVNALYDVDGVTDIIKYAGEYHNYLQTQKPGDSPYRTYKLEIETIYGTIIDGVLTCYAAGTMDDPFSLYDTTCQFWRRRE